MRGAALGLGAALAVGVAMARAPAAAAPTEADAAQLRRGEAVYIRCSGCHSLKTDRTGPRHCGLLGRQAGTVPGFRYSEAMTTSGITWTAASLDAFLTRPTEFVVGTAMPFAGIAEATERADLIAWLTAAGRDPDLCPPPSP